MAEKYPDYFYEVNWNKSKQRQNNDIQIHKKIKKYLENIPDSANQLSI